MIGFVKFLRVGSWLFLIFTFFFWVYQVVWAWERFWQEFILLFAIMIYLVPLLELVPYLEGKKVLDVKKFKTQKLSNKNYVLFSMLCLMFGHLFLLSWFMVDAYPDIVMDAYRDMFQKVPFWLVLVISIFFSIPLWVLISPIQDSQEYYRARGHQRKQAGKKAQLEEKRKKKKEELEKTREDAILHLENINNENTLEYEKLEERIKKYQSNIEEEKETILVLQEKYPFIGQIVTNRLV